MNNDEKNRGAGPIQEDFGKSDTDDSRQKTDSRQDTRQTDGSSGRADQERVADNDTSNQGHDDLDEFDMNSLKGKVGNDRKGENQ
ncbi:MAG: hypothetical protein EOP49_25105 [Sphingobacteriales bacterium]|nr:MAG: hypothetical protein EOP49_25105 [Sphingobacteriales bacterium]